MTDLRAQVIEAVRQIQRQIRWKPDSAERHLRKRQRRGHLPVNATLFDYEEIIRDVVADRTATVYLYYHNATPYVTVVSSVQAQIWLVMFGLDGILESAYILDHPHTYLSKPVFKKLGSLENVLA